MLAQADAAAYLAHQVRGNHPAAHLATETSPVSSAEPYTKVLAIVGCAAEGHVREDVRFVSCQYLRNIPNGPPIPEDAGPPPEP